MDLRKFVHILERSSSITDRFFGHTMYHKNVQIITPSKEGNSEEKFCCLWERSFINPFSVTDVPIRPPLPLVGCAQQQNVGEL